MATIYQVAELAGVSPATVSRVINGASVSPAYRDRVERATQSLGFTPNRAARNLRLQTSDVIALVIPDVENPFFTSLARGVEDVAQAAGFSVVLCNSDEQQDKQARYLRIALAQSMAGIVLAPAHGEIDVEAVLARGTPLVAVDRSIPGSRTDAVVADNTAGGRVGAEQLFDAGFERVACISGPADVETARLRSEGWSEVFQARAPGLDPAQYLRHADYRVEGGAQAVAALLDGAGAPRPSPDAFFVANNLMAVGAYQALLERGTPPPTVGLAAFGDLPFASLREVGVLVLPLPSRQLGVRAATLLLERIRGVAGAPRLVVVPNEVEQPLPDRLHP